MWAYLTELMKSLLSTLTSVTGSPGFAIILLTVLIRVVLHPLNVKQMRSMQQMQKLQPRLKVLQEKYGDDRETLGRETMALYKEYGVNPAAGCFPLLLQLPVLILLFSALRTADYGGRTFFGLSLEGSLVSQLALATNMPITDPSQLGVFSVFGWVFGHPAGLANISVYGMNLLFVVLIVVLTYLQQKMSTGNNPEMKTMLIIMPLMLAYISLSLPGGVALYWAVSSIMGVAQQYWINAKVAREPKPVLYQEKPKKEDM